MDRSVPSVEQPEPPALLSPETVADYLRGRGIVNVTSGAAAWELAGGVSNVVLAVASDRGVVVVKQALPRLRVASRWEAKQGRILNEAVGLGVAGRLTPGVVPRVLDVDVGRYAITITGSPAHWVDWKSQLLGGTVDPGVGRRLGEVLGAWHAAPLTPTTRAQLDDPDAFEQLRIDPYHRTVMRRCPELAPLVMPRVHALKRADQALVHGDFSPKNVVVGDGELWVLDFEVAHIGAPVFDVAFLLSHLLLKSARDPTRAPDLALAASAFLEGYVSAVRGMPALGIEDVFGHVGCLLLARVEGKSPAEYLDAARRRVVFRLGTSFLNAPPSDIGECWSRLAGELR